jgi:dephospho-CoA kinase
MKRVKLYLETKVIGVTGGIGSGQSAACDIFSRLGCKVLNLDLKAKQLVDRDRTLQNEIKMAFGASVFKEKTVIDRRLLGQIVFSDQEKLQRLNRIIHPKLVPIVVEDMEAARFSQKYPLVIMDAALIYELNLEQTFDAIVVIYADQKTRIERIKKRDQMTHQEVIARINNQIPLEEKKAWADFVIDNIGTLNELQKETEKVYQKLIEDIPVQRKIRIE